MPVIVVTSNTPGAGKTGVAAAIARHYAYQGLAVRLVRVADGSPGADADAAYFGDLAFVPGSPTAAIPAADVREPADRALLVVEASEGSISVPGAAVVSVGRGSAPASPQDGVAATITMAVHGITERKTMKPETGALSILVGDDRTLAGFSVSEVRTALRAEVLVEGDGPETTCDHLVIAPIASDAGQPYFRRFDSKAVVVRFDKTDQHLAAIQSEPAVLILTGGRRPSVGRPSAATSGSCP